MILIATGLFSKTFYKSMVVLSQSYDGATQSASSFGSLFASRASLEAENTELRRRLGESELALSDRDIVLKENADLKALQRIEQETGRIAASVIAKPPFAPFDVIVINKGSEQSVKEGDKAFIGQTLVGTVTSVSDATSRVTLLSAPLLKTEAYIGESAIPATLSGKGGGNFEANLPQGSEVKTGDLTYVYHSDESYLIGKVSAVIEEEGSTLVRVLFSFPFNIYSLTYVEISQTN